MSAPASNSTPAAAFVYVSNAVDASISIYRLDRASGALAHVATAPLPDSMTYISTDRSGRWLFGASYRGDVVSAGPIDARGIARDGAPQVIRAGRHPRDRRRTRHPETRGARARRTGRDLGRDRRVRPTRRVSDSTFPWQEQPR